MSTLRYSRLLVCSTVVLAAIACGPPATISTPMDRGLAAPVTPADMVQLYRGLGLIASPPPLALVGKVSYFATRSPDTTLVLTSISLPNRSLTFAREGDRYRAPYEVRLRLLRGDVEVASVNALEVVRVAAFKEINRFDESVIFQHFFRVPPGAYSWSLLFRDVGGSRMTTQESAISVPRFGSQGFSTPVVTYEAGSRENLDSAPRLLASARSSAVFGQDSTVSIFIEGYGAGSRLPITFTVTNDQRVRVLTDSVTLVRHGSLFSGTVPVPISTVGLGTARLSFYRRDAADTAGISIFVSFGEDIPAMSFENMISYLRFFAPPFRLNALRDAPPAQRASVWAAFLRETDPVPETPVNEALQLYFALIDQANIRFANDHNPGWISDRGMVFVALGEPNQMVDRTVTQGVSRTQSGEDTQIQIWDYPQYRTQIVFYQDSGRWRLTRSSENEFWAVTARKLGR